MPHLPYTDRSEAGRVLADALDHYAGRSDLLVLALPRGGVPVAYEVAHVLDAPLDLMIVRKLGLPGQEELAMGAIASGGGRVLNKEVIHGWWGVSDDVVEAVTQRETQELRRRERAYRGDRPDPELAGRCVILVDDGLATGSTMRAAVSAVKHGDPGRIVVAVPVAPPDTIDTLSAQVDEVVCPATPASFRAVGQWYVRFPQTSDDEVRDLLKRAWARQPNGSRS